MVTLGTEQIHEITKLTTANDFYSIELNFLKIQSEKSMPMCFRITVIDIIHARNEFKNKKNRNNSYNKIKRFYRYRTLFNEYEMTLFKQ